MIAQCPTCEVWWTDHTLAGPAPRWAQPPQQVCPDCQRYASWLAEQGATKVAA